VLWKPVPLLSWGEQYMEWTYHVKSLSGSNVIPWPGNEIFVHDHWVPICIFGNGIRSLKVMRHMWQLQLGNKRKMLLCLVYKLQPTQNRCFILRNVISIHTTCVICPVLYRSAAVVSSWAVTCLIPTISIQIGLSQTSPCAFYRLPLFLLLKQLMALNSPQLFPCWFILYHVSCAVKVRLFNYWLALLNTGYHASCAVKVRLFNYWLALLNTGYHSSCAVHATSYFYLHSCTRGSSYLGRQNVHCYQQTIVLRGTVCRNLMCGTFQGLIDWLHLDTGPHGPDAPRPYLTGPLCPLSNHGSPVSLPKFQMAPKLTLLISSGSREKEPRCISLSEAKASHSQRMWGKVSSFTPHPLHSGLSSPSRWIQGLKCSLCRKEKTFVGYVM
jgi:hypothetical protein